METPGITAAPSARTRNPLAPKISPLLPGSGMVSWCECRRANVACQRIGNSNAIVPQCPRECTPRRRPAPAAAERCGRRPGPRGAGGQWLLLPPAHWPGTALSEHQQHTLGSARRQFSPGVGGKPAAAAGPPPWRALARQAALRGKRVAVLEPAAYGGCKDVNSDALTKHTVRYTATNPARFERLWR